MDYMDLLRENKFIIGGVAIAIIVVVVIITQFLKSSEKYYMYGPWIGTPVEVQNTVALNDGTKVYMIKSADGYTKMVTDKGESKYYTGDMSAFDSTKWDTYNAVPKGNYVVATCPSSATGVSSTGQCL